MPALTASSSNSINLNTPNQRVMRKGLLQYIGIPHHEYWPWWMLVAPVWPLWLWYCLRLQNATWFTTVNPSIEDGGFMGESKIRILELIPDDLKPKTLFINHKSIELNKNEISKNYGATIFPIIAKPDIGGRGRKIKIVNNWDELALYHNTVDEDYMLQEIIEGPLEVGVFYAKIPGEETGKIISMASKGFLKVKGDGVSSIADLMRIEKRSSIQLERLEKEIDTTRILPLDEEILLEPIGNHCRGTTFINEEMRISEKMNATFDTIANNIGGIYYGRFDIRVPSWKDLENGKNIAILELNGLTSDPTHIFDPEYKLRDVFKTQLRHIRIAAKIAKANLKAGVKSTPFVELAKKSWAAFKLM